jgi:integrase
MGDNLPSPRCDVRADLRVSEAVGLMWGDVEFDEKRIARQLDPDGTIRNATETKSSTALVPLLPALERELRAHRLRQAEIDLRLVRASSLVFTTSQGKPQLRRNALRALHNAGDAAGLRGENVQRIGNHDLRHSYISLALDAANLAEASLLEWHANEGHGADVRGRQRRGERADRVEADARGFGS